MQWNGWETEDKLVPNKGEERYTNPGTAEDEGKEEREEEIGLYRRKKPIEIALPDTVLSNEPSLREKTLKYYYILRSLSIFRVDKIVIYRDPVSRGKREYRIIKSLHKYYITPPYLRRKLIPLNPLLRYVGNTPPLRLLIHSVEKNPRKGEFRIAYIVESRGKQAKAYVGLGTKVAIECIDPCPPKAVAAILVKEVNPLLLVYRRKYSRLVYTGPLLSYASNLLEYSRRLRRSKYYVIATSKYGERVTLQMLHVLGNKAKEAKGILAVFGAPYHGLYEIYRELGSTLESETDIVLNTLPYQGTRTVRTEEALHSTLTLINIVVDDA